MHILYLVLLSFRVSGEVYNILKLENVCLTVQSNFIYKLTVTILREEELNRNRKEH